MAQIPLIDLRPYFDGSDKAGVAARIKTACLDIGFFTITGHGIPLAKILSAHEMAKAFFDLPHARKKQMEAPGGMGYIGPDGENLAASLDDQQVQDVKESLNLTMPPTDAIWPGEPAGLHPACKSYYDALINLSSHLMRLFALALDMPEHWFDDKVDQPRTILRLLNYPEISAANDQQVRAGSHTDYGTLTILWSPDSRGLQAQNRDGEWVDVVAPQEHFIINIGDLMMNWTNDKWLSTLHRVMPHPETLGRRRQSMAFFHNPNPDAVIACIDSCHSETDPPRYEPILAKAHLEMKIAKSLGKDIKL